MMRMKILYLIIFSLPLRMLAQNCSRIITNMNYSLNDVAYISDESFIAVGDGGKVIKTTNAGINWKEMNSGTTITLYKAQFLTDNIGYMIGSCNNLFKTEDAGKNWFPIKFKLSTSPCCDGFYFTSADTGFLFGEYSDTYKTTDGGKSWKRNSSSYVKSMFFINDSTGFSCKRSSVSKTTDCGKSWTNTDLSSFAFGLNFIKIIFTDQNVGYILSRDGTIIKTTNGGITWVIASKINISNAISMCFVNNSKGYVLGGWDSRLIYKTVDGGSTWQLENSYLAGSAMGMAYIPSGTKGITVGSAERPGGRFILYTDNSGLDWKHSCLIDGRANFTDMAIFNDSIIYLFGGETYYGSGYKSIDAGLLWTKLPPVQSNIVDCFFLNKDTGFVLGDLDSISKTTDGGLSWSTVPGLKTSGFGCKIYFFSVDFGFYIDQQYILRTTNGGIKWDTVAKTNFMVNDIMFINDSSGFILGNYVIKRTTDKGKSWTTLNNFSNDCFLTICYKDNNTVYISGQKGVMYKSLDNGINWSKIDTKFTNRVVGLKFFNNTFAVAVANSGGGLGYIYYSYDGGTNWTLEKEISYDLSKVEYRGNGEAFIIGESGLFLKTGYDKRPSIPSYVIGDQKIVKKVPYTFSVIDQLPIQYVWNISNNQVFESNNDSILVNFTETGKYTITVTPSNTCGFGETRKFEVDVYDTLTMNINNHIIENLKIYPNPFIDKIKILLPDKLNKNVVLNVYNMQGIIIKSLTYDCTDNNRELILNLNGFKSGIYLFNVIQDNIVYTSRIVKL